MSGNSFGKQFIVTTFGESHGPMYGCVVDGCPPGVFLSEADIQTDLDRRKPGGSRFTSQRREADVVRIVSGVFEGKTTGTPIGLLIENTAQRSSDYDAIKDVFRPGHADITYEKKYGMRDYRGGGRASARETMMRVAAGAVAKKVLQEQFGVTLQGYLAALGDITMETIDLSIVESNPFFCPDADKLSACEALIQALRKEGNSIGAKIHVTASHVPVGLGAPVFDRLDADIAKAMMSIPAVKGVEIGSGFQCVTQKGSEHRDEITPEGFLTNHAGGVLGGISTGQTIDVSIAFKPTSSIILPGKTIDANGEPADIVTKGRHDPCVGLRATPIAEAMLALVLMDHVMRHRGQCG